MIIELWFAFILWIFFRMAMGDKYQLCTVGFGGGGSTSTSTTTQVVEPSTPEDIALKKIDLEFSELNLERFKQEQNVIDRILAGGGEDSIVDSARIEQELLPLREAAARAELENAPELARLQFAQIRAAEERIPLEQAILQEQVASIERGGLPSPQVEQEIDRLLAASRDIGITSIEESARRARGDILEDIAPSRGLRGRDSPILSQLSDIGEQVVTQTGQLERKLAESRSSLAIGQPIQIGQLSQAITAPSLNRTAQVPFSPSSFLPQVNPTIPSLGSATAARGAASTSFAPTFGPQFFVTGTTQSSGRGTGAGQGGAIVGGLGSAAAGIGIAV